MGVDVCAAVKQQQRLSAGRVPRFRPSSRIAQTIAAPVDPQVMTDETASFSAASRIALTIEASVC